MQCDLETHPTVSDMHAGDTTPLLLLLLLRNMISSQLKQFAIAQCVFARWNTKNFHNTSPIRFRSAV